MDVQHIIQEALIEYDQTKPTMHYLLKNMQIILEKNENDLQRDVIKFINKDTNKLEFTSDTEIIGLYYEKLKIWSWGWSLAGRKTSEYYLSKEILIYALSMGPELAYIKSLLTTSRGIINDPTQIDINLAISLSIIKKPYVLQYVYKVGNDNIIIYYIILDVKKMEEIKNSLKY